jgi:excisionase family DNA binding protein
LLTVQETAKLLACSEAVIRKWIYQQRLPAVKIGRLVRVSVVDLEKFAAGAPLDKRSDEQ